MTHDDQGARPWTLLIFILPLGLILAAIGVKLASPQAYLALIREDGPLENTQFVCYAAAGLLCLWAGLRLRATAPGLQTWAVLLVGLGLLLVAGEEISWGERLLGYGLPEWFAVHNVQHEVSLHNLAPVQNKLSLIYIAAGLGLGLGWSLRSRLAWPSLGRNWTALLECLPPWSLCPYFLPTALIYGYFVVGFYLAKAQGRAAGFGNQGVIFWWDQEPVETLFALGCLLWAGWMLWNAVRRRQLPRLGALVEVAGRTGKQP